ncbi:oligopeptide transporter ATP-binding component [Devosia sp. Root413D1]|jgi:oligopeptide transport system ATP-binding protein|uniref:ABC transporter ATP-binding protein n=1 Tax=unclassified Devosia TaxID=196773 RepID=UPI0006F579F0|nr:MULTISPECIES: ABC transporter ATP-binding protein [unclassified Devosia]KQU95785.1 oligopeptide transporter ATP-binding component [Devosia sp. Root105]KQW78161.1 oligopeptide transporter ATP-binding component [Devosia sp. Root413D1]
MADVLVVDNLDVTFALHQSEVKAVSDLDFTLAEGETLAVVGESGSGKSQAFLSIMGLLARNGKASGRAMLGDVNLIGMSPDRLDRYRGKDIAMIFQDPMTSLNPTLKVKTQLAEVLVRHQGYTAEKANRAVIEMLERVGIPEPVKRANAYPHELSGGMRQRVMIAMALLCKPKVLIADEPTTALDVTVQAQMLDLFKNLTNDFGTALVLITHDLGVVAGVADRMMVMYGGRCIEKGPTDTLFYDPRHPYTLGLLHSTPHVAKRAKRLDPIQGLPPSLEHLPKGCAFHPRCAFRFERCFEERPPLLPVEDVREKACWYQGELKYEAVA